MFEPGAAPAEGPWPSYNAFGVRGTKGGELGEAVAAPDGAVVVTGYRACSTVIRDNRLRKSPGAMLSAVGFPDWEQRPSLQMMGREHADAQPAPAQAAAAAGFALVHRSAHSGSALRDLTNADEHCEPLDGTVEFLDAIAFPLPVAVIGELLGIPAADRAMFQPLVREWTSVLEFLHPLASDQADMTGSEMRRYLGELAQIRRAEPADDLISALVVDEDEGQQLSEDELVTMVRADPRRGV